MARSHIAGANSRGHQRLALRRVVGISGTDFKQRNIGKSPRRVLAGRTDEMGQHARAHHHEIGRDRIDQAQAHIAAAIEPRFAVGNERPGHRFDHPSRRQRSPDRHCAHLAHGQNRFRQPAIAGQRHRRDFIEAGQAQGFFNEIRFDFEIAPPGRNRDIQDAARGIDRAAQAFQQFLGLRLGQIEPAQVMDSRRAKFDEPPPIGLTAGDRDFARAAAAEFENYRRRRFHAGNDRGRIDAALKPVSCFRFDGESTPGFGGSYRIEQSAFQKDRRCLVRAAGSFAADDAAET